MKTIVLIRHAREAGGKKGVDDSSRPLLKKGVKDARKMADILKSKISGKRLFISSPADRALETANIFAEKLDYPPTKIVLKEPFYRDLKSTNFLPIIKEIPDTYDTVMLFGHNPSLSEFVSSLLCGVQLDIPKSGLAMLHFKEKSWQNIKAQTGMLTYMLYPSAKSKKSSDFGKTLSEQLTQSMMAVLTKINHDATNSIIKSIEKDAEKIAHNFLKTLT